MRMERYHSDGNSHRKWTKDVETLRFILFLVKKLVWHLK